MERGLCLLSEVIVPYDHRDDRDQSYIYPWLIASVGLKKLSLILDF